MSKTMVLESRNVALFAAQEELNKKGIRGDEFAIESYQETKRHNNTRFVVLGLVTRNGGKAQVAIRLEKSSKQWNSRGVKVLSVENAPYRLLAYLKVQVDLENAVLLLKAFMSPFPSLEGVDPYDVVRVVSSPESFYQKEDPEKEGSLELVQMALDEASYGGEWPGTVIVKDTSSWSRSQEITLTPYVGDRSISVWGGHMGFGHGRVWGYLTVTIDCMDRPSSFAMKDVISWIYKNGAKFNAEAFWAGDRVAREPENDLFKMNRAMAQYYAHYAPDQKAPYMRPNQYSEYSLTDWLVTSLNVLESAQRTEDQKLFESEVVVLREILGAPPTVFSSMSFTIALVKGLIVKQLESGVPINTKHSLQYSAKRHAQAKGLPWPPEESEEEEPSEFLGSSKIFQLNHLFDD